MELKASAFAASLPGGRASGRLLVQDGAVVFEASGHRVALPLDGLVLKVGGANNSLLFVSHPQLPEWTLYTPDRSLLQAPAVAAQPAAQALRQQLGRRRLAGLSLAVVVVAVLVALPLALVAGWGAITQAAARQVPVAWEEQLGASVIDEYASQGSLDCDSEAAARLAAMADELISTLPAPRYSFRFCIADDPALNAFAVPGGSVVVHTGLINAAATAPELLGVLAHEVAHVTAQHGIRSVINSMGWLVALQLMFGDASGLVGAAVQAAPLLIHLQYSQGFESEADRIAVGMLESAQVDPGGLVRFFDRLIKEEQDAGVTVPEFLSTHPATADRIEEIQALMTHRPAPRADLEQHLAELKRLTRISHKADQD